MALQKVRLGSLEVTRLAIGGNPFSGHAHQTPQRAAAMRKYYTVARIKEALHKAEAAGINTLFARADWHIMRLLAEYWDEGGKIQWIAQTAPEWVGCEQNVTTAASYGAKGIYLHGGQADHYFARGETDRYRRFLDQVKSLNLAAGLAAHLCEPHEWYRDHLAPDFHLTCYFNPSARDKRPDNAPQNEEVFDPAHRDRMAGVIQTLKAPAVHYKVLAAGRLPVQEAMAYVAKVLRPQDVVLVGFFLGDNPDMIQETVGIFQRALQPQLA